MDYASALRRLTDLFAQSGLEVPRRQAEWILQHVTGVDRVRRLADPAAELSDSECLQADALAARRLSGEPLQYVLGQADFCGLRLRVTPAVLIPRPETEQLVELVSERIPARSPARLLDVGTGSGCIPLALRYGRPELRTWACDESAAALSVAWRNARRLGIPVSFYRANALRRGFAAAFTGALDAMVSNPPYVARHEREALPVEVRDHEPPEALFAGGDALEFYRSITREAANVLRPQGQLFFEAHEERADMVALILEKQGFIDVATAKDFAGKKRFVSGRLQLARGRASRRK